MTFPESAIAHRWLDPYRDGVNLEIGGSAHNPWGLDTKNVDYTDDLTTVFKKGEIAMCGRSLPVDIIGDAEHLPLPDKSVNFIVSSHVLEHVWDPIGALQEQARVARKHLLHIVPHRDALASDREKPLTPLAELQARHDGTIPRPEDTLHAHHTRWTLTSLIETVEAAGLRVVEAHESDDKCGNGHLVVIAVD